MLEKELVKADLIYNATIALGKGYDYEEMYYGDYMYGNEDQTEAVFEYVNEAQEIGSIAFKKKYSEYAMYPGF